MYTLSIVFVVLVASTASAALNTFAVTQCATGTIITTNEYPFVFNRVWREDEIIFACDANNSRFLFQVGYVREYTFANGTYNVFMTPGNERCNFYAAATYESQFIAYEALTSLNGVDGLDLRLARSEAEKLSLHVEALGYLTRPDDGTLVRLYFGDPSPNLLNSLMPLVITGDVFYNEQCATDPDSLAAYFQLPETCRE